MVICLYAIYVVLKREKKNVKIKESISWGTQSRIIDLTKARQFLGSLLFTKSIIVSIKQ